MSTIYNKHTDNKHTPLEELGLKYHQIRNLDNRLNQHAIQHATKLILTRYALKHRVSGRGVGLGASARNPPDPH